MSEIINNREQHTEEVSERLQKILDIFRALYNGENVDQVKVRFDQEIGTVTVEEVSQISQMQRDILEAGDYSESETKRLSDAHMSILKGNIEEPPNPEDVPGHPVHTFKLENKALDELIQTRLKQHVGQFIEEDSEEQVYKLLEDCNLLFDIDKHYMRKEHLIFPYLEKYGIYGPSTNMWRMDDMIRDGIKELKRKLTDYKGDRQAVLERVKYVIDEIYGMIYREETILFPMAMSQFTEEEWVKIAAESDEIGFCLTAPTIEWKPERKDLDAKVLSDGFVKFETGVLSLKQLELILNHLPVDITFIDHEDVVRYFSQGKERIFARTKAVIGRTVQNCHPPKSVHMVEDLLDDFKSGKKDVEEFWIKFRDRYVLIRYFAVRDENNQYLGTLEFTQDIGPIQAIEGEKRILSCPQDIISRSQQGMRR